MDGRSHMSDMSERDTWRELRRFELRREAEAVHEQLRAAGIAAVIPDTRVMGIHPSCRVGPDDVRVLVKSGDFERAAMLLALTQVRA